MVERAALARAAKQAKLDNISGDCDDPGPSQPLSAQYQKAREIGNGHNESESENERNLSSDEDE